MDDVNQEEGGGGYYCRGGDGEDPGPDDASGDAPADGREAMQGAYADDGSGDGVSGADGDAGEGGTEEGGGSRAPATETAKGLEFGDLLPHGVDDAPFAERLARV